jgi:anti-sigma-K factor RskA
MRCEYARDDGAYVLGALTPAERATYERHMATCPGCRDAVAEMAVLPGLLSRLDAVTAERVAREAEAVEASRLPRLLRAAEESQRRLRTRRRWQAWGAALAAACLALVAGLGIAGLQPSVEREDRPPVAMVPMVEGDVSGPVTAEVGVIDIHGGTKVWMHCAYPITQELHRPYPFWLVAVGTDGTTEPIGSWEAGSGDDMWMSGLTRYAMARLDRLELRSTKGILLVYQLP